MYRKCWDDERKIAGGGLNVGKEKSRYLLCPAGSIKNNGITTLGSGGNKYKFWYSGADSGTNGVGILVRHELMENVIEKDRFNDP